MNSFQSVIKALRGAALAGLAFAAFHSMLGCVYGQQVEIGLHAVLPGSTVRVPVRIRNAPVLASASLQINFDPQLLTLNSVTKGDLGVGFILAYQSGAGTIRIAAVRPDALTNASGALVVLEFQANSGAQASASSTVALANRSLSGSFGEDLEWANTILQTNGAVRVVSALQDSDGLGLPDWWQEKYFGMPTGTNPSGDPDRDGRTNLQEYLAGTNPMVAQVELRIVSITADRAGTILRHTTLSGRTHWVEYSEDLVHWTRLAQSVAGNGNEVQKQLSEPARGASRFYRVVVEP